MGSSYLIQLGQHGNSRFENGTDFSPFLKICSLLQSVVVPQDAQCPQIVYNKVTKQPCATWNNRMTIPTNKQLREFILASFNESELALFCFDNFEEAELYFSDNMPMLDRAVELIKYCKRQGKMEDLLRALEQERPHLNWPEPKPGQAEKSPPEPVQTAKTGEQEARAAISRKASEAERELKGETRLPPHPKLPDPQSEKPAKAPTEQRPKPARQATPHSESFVHEKTGLEFVRIPEGKFLYGDDKKRIHLPEYWISKTPVTNTVYKIFIDVNPAYPVPNIFLLGGKYNWDKSKRTFKPELAEPPVALVNWRDAIAFCEWAGLLLPTEEQWEKAARGTDGRIYPWGNDEPTAKLCNFNRNVGGTTPVGQYSPQGDSPYGCVDMSGNVWEWCFNKYDKPEDTGIDQSNDRRVLRGGSWANNLASVRAVSRYRGHPAFRSDAYGIRVVARRPPSQ